MDKKRLEQLREMKQIGVKAYHETDGGYDVEFFTSKPDVIKEQMTIDEMREKVDLANEEELYLSSM